MTGHRFLRSPMPMLVAVVLAAGFLGACSASDATAACGGADDGADAVAGLPDSLRVGVANNIAMAAPLTGLDSLGIADTELTTASTPEELRTNFIADRYDVAAMPINIAANLCAQGIDLALLGTVSGNIVHLIGPEGTTFDSLRGQTLHVPFQNDILDLVTRSVLDAAGLSYTGPDADVTLAYHPTPLDIASGLASGSMTYAVLPEHLATVVVGTVPGMVKAVGLQDLWTQQTGTTALPFAGFVVRGELARTRPDLISALQANLLASVISVSAAPAVGAEEISEVIPVPADVVARVLPDMRPVYLPASDSRADVEALYETLLEAVPDSIGGEMPSDGFYLGSGS